MRPTSTTLGPITMTNICRYAGASGDFNPLHHDPEFAARAGYDRVVVMGALSGGWLANELSRDFEGGPITVEVAYRRPVLLKDELRVESTNAGAMAVRADEAAETVVRVAISQQCDLGAWSTPPLVSPYPLVVEEGAVREFRRAVLADDPFNGAVPVTFPVTVTRWRPTGDGAVRELGFDYRRMLHRRSTFRYVDGPLQVGEGMEVFEHYGPRSLRTRSNGQQMNVAIVQWTFVHGSDVRAQMEYEMVELIGGPV